LISILPEENRQIKEEKKEDRQANLPVFFYL